MIYIIIAFLSCYSTLLSAECGTVPYPSNTGHVTPKPISKSPKVWSFVSEPDLHPMKIHVNRRKEGTAAGFIFVAPYAFSSETMYGQTGSLMMDQEGIPIWFHPLGSPNLMNIDFRVQTLKGKSVLTFWQGTLATPPGYTNLPAASSEPGSCYYILDNSYRVIKTVTAQLGFTSDIHEFLLTPSGTALFLCTKAVPMDLTPYGGPQNGFVNDFAVQEVDLKTNQLLFFWDALQNIPLTDSFEPASSATSSNNIWDAYHLNSIGLTEDVDDILVSGRNTWTLYKIHKPTGSIVWRLGGKQSDFTIEKGAEFSWQHDARFLPQSTITLFDDNCCENPDDIPPGTPPARGLALQLNFADMTARLKHAYYHDPNINVASQGNVQTLPSSNKFIGWGQSKYFSEFTEAGRLLYDAQMPGDNISYRAYRHTWVGTPHYPPKIAVKSKKGKTTVYASWNGSTKTRSWVVFAGKSRKKLHKVAKVPKSGFETAIRVRSAGPYFQVKALNGKGEVIGVSKIAEH